MAQLKYLGTTVTNQNLIREDIKKRLNSGNSCYQGFKAYTTVKHSLYYVYRSIGTLFLNVSKYSLFLQPLPPGTDLFMNYISDIAGINQSV
jgi:hypothetical protein